MYSSLLRIFARREQRDRDNKEKREFGEGLRGEVRTLSGPRLARALEQCIQVDADAVREHLPEPAGREARDALEEEHKRHPSARTWRSKAAL